LKIRQNNIIPRL